MRVGGSDRAITPQLAGQADPPGIGRPHVTVLTIGRLGERDIGPVINCIVGNTPLPSTILQDIIERTDGIPLFVEEMKEAPSRQLRRFHRTPSRPSLTDLARPRWCER
jgi:hypothetical protein